METTTQHRIRTRRALAFAGIIGLLLMLWAVLPSRAWFARRQLQVELKSVSPTADEELERLSRFVKIGDHIDTVRKRLTDFPTSEERGVDDNTYWSLGLDGVNLELAVTKHGRVVGIGRYIWGTDDEVVWYEPVWWPDHVEGAG